MASIEDLIRTSKADASVNGRDAVRGDLDIAVEYSEGEMLEDTRNLLKDRYPHTQQGDSRQQIAPLTVPLFQRFLDESATAYTQNVHRKLVHRESKEENKDLSSLYKDLLDEIGFDQILSTVDRRTIGLKSCVVFPQVEQGDLDPLIFNPQEIFPVANEGATLFNAANAKSYAGFVLDTQNEKVVATTGKVLEKTFAFVSREETVIFKGKSPLDPQERVAQFDNPYTWPQRLIDNSGRPTNTVTDQPILPLVFWHQHKPEGCLIPLHTPSMLTANRELNVLWSVLFDIIRLQGGATPVIEKSKPHAAEAFRVIGVRHPVVIQGGGFEGMNFVTAANNYSGLVDTLQTFNRLIALAHRMSPGDFSVEQQQAQSGFAKLVENLPKIEGRKQRIKWYKLIEKRMYPVIASILIWLDKLPLEAKQYEVSVEFEDTKIPKSVEERIREEEHDFKHGIRTPAQVLSERNGISIEEAEEKIRENKVSMPTRSIFDLGSRTQPGIFAQDIAETSEDENAEDE